MPRREVAGKIYLTLLTLHARILTATWQLLTLLVLAIMCSSVQRLYNLPGCLLSFYLLFVPYSLLWYNNNNTSYYYCSYCYYHYGLCLPGNPRQALHVPSSPTQIRVIPAQGSGGRTSVRLSYIVCYLPSPCFYSHYLTTEPKPAPLWLQGPCTSLPIFTRMVAFSEEKVTASVSDSAVKRHTTVVSASLANFYGDF